MLQNNEGIVADYTYANSQYKDTLFRGIFKDKKNLLSLYNALNHSNYTDEEELEIKTLKNAVYMAIKNDVSFVFNDALYLFEHQSSFNPNMPLRYLFYVSAQFSAMVPNKQLHSSKIAKIPAPRFVVFYNGLEEQPDKRELRLSDSYIISEKEPSLELKAQMFNINLGHNPELLEACKVLKDYATYVDKMRNYAKEMPIELALDKTVAECIELDILRDFLTNNKAEAKQMSIFEYDYKGHMELIREEGIEEGIEKGITLVKKIMKLDAAGKSIEDIAKECELTPEEVKKIIED